MKIAFVVGARPQFIKVAMLSPLIRQRHTEVLIHTGQHYDDRMSGVFFRELGIPQPEYNLEVGSGGHGEQTGLMLARLEPILLAERPDLILIDGDTNSTIVGALAGAKLHIPVAHVEAGLRSFDRRMPEEINRVVADQLSEYLFCPTETAVAHLHREGIGASPGVPQHIYNTGDVMYDAVLHYAAMAEQQAAALFSRLEVTPGSYRLATVHRAANTDDLARLQAITRAFAAIAAADCPLIFPVHPRTHKVLAELDLPTNPHLKLIEPVTYLEMLALERGAQQILTDSGGVQREAYFLAVPCITLREETEWVETVANGWSRLVGADTGQIVTAAHSFQPPSGNPPPVFGDGHASEKIVNILEQS